MDLESGTTLSHYRLVEQVGRGGMGIVYRAKDLTLGREVAIKVLPPRALDDSDSRRRLLKEARILSRLNHPNIQIVFEFDSHEAIDFLVTEFIPGTSLRDRIRQGPVPENRATRFGLQIAEALAAAHESGVIHRDLSARNILLTGEARIKIIDFGLARVLRPLMESASTEKLTEEIAGTLPYMPPEAFQGAVPDARSDIYSAGVILYEMVTGRLPFRAESAGAMIQAIQAEPPPPLSRTKSRVSPRLEEILLKCLEKDPDRRYQSARELAVDLRRLVEPGMLPLLPRRHRLAWSAVGIGLLLAIALLLRALGLPGSNRSGWEGRNPRMSAVVAWPGYEGRSRISPDRQWIAFLGDRSGRRSIWRSHISGGVPEEIVTESGNITSCAWSPDGLEIVYLLISPGDVSLKFVSAFGGPSTRHRSLDSIFRDALLVRWLGNHLYIEVVGDGLWRLGPDGDGGEKILEAESDGGLRSEFDVSPDERRVIYSIYQEGRSVLWTCAIDGSGVVGLSGPQEQDYGPRWLGEHGTGFIYASKQGGQANLWYRSLSRPEPHQITFGSLPEFLEDVAVDGSLLTFSREMESASLWVASRGSTPGEADQVSVGAPADFLPSIRESTLVFQRRAPGNEGGGGVFDATIYGSRLGYPGSASEQLLASEGGLPSLSPHGDLMAFVRESKRASAWEVWLMQIPGGTERRVLEGFLPPRLTIRPLSFMDQNLAWSASGETLFAVSSAAGACRIQGLPTHSPRGTPETLHAALPGGLIRDVYPSADGEWLAFIEDLPGDPRRQELRVLDLRSGECRILFASGDGGQESLQCRGWMMGSGKILLLRSRSNPDWTQEVELLECSKNGVRPVGALTRAFVSTTRFCPRWGFLAYVALDAATGVANLRLYDVARATSWPVTENRSPATTFAGLDFIQDGSIVFSRLEYNQDVWLVRFDR